MKLATLKSETSRDGKLCVVSQDLTKASFATPYAKTLQAALEISPGIQTSEHQQSSRRAAQSLRGRAIKVNSA